MKFAAEAAFLKSYEREGLVRWVQRFARDREDAEEVVQDALIKVFVAAQDREFERREHWVSYCRTAADRVALDLLRRRRGTKRATVNAECPAEFARGELEVADDRPSPEEDTSRREQLHVINQAIGKMRSTAKGDRDVTCLLLWLDENTHEKIAEECHMDRAEVTRRVIATRERLIRLARAEFRLPLEQATKRGKAA